MDTLDNFTYNVLEFHSYCVIRKKSLVFKRNACREGCLLWRDLIQQ